MAGAGSASSSLPCTPHWQVSSESTHAAAVRHARQCPQLQPAPALTSGRCTWTSPRCVTRDPGRGPDRPPATIPRPAEASAPRGALLVAHRRRMRRTSGGDHSWSFPARRRIGWPRPQRPGSRYPHRPAGARRLGTVMSGPRPNRRLEQAARTRGRQACPSTTREPARSIWSRAVSCWTGACAPAGRRSSRTTLSTAGRGWSRHCGPPAG